MKHKNNAEELEMAVCNYLFLQDKITEGKFDTQEDLRILMKQADEDLDYMRFLVYGTTN